jgi:hypothetical protein
MPDSAVSPYREQLEQSENQALFQGRATPPEDIAKLRGKLKTSDKTERAEMLRGFLKSYTAWNQAFKKTKHVIEPQILDKSLSDYTSAVNAEIKLLTGEDPDKKIPKSNQDAVSPNIDVPESKVIPVAAIPYVSPSTNSINEDPVLNQFMSDVGSALTDIRDVTMSGFNGIGDLFNDPGLQMWLATTPLGVESEILVDEAEVVIAKGEQAFEEFTSIKGVEGLAKGGGTGATFADESKLIAHFEDHAADFGASTPAEYQHMADTFLTGPKTIGTHELVRGNGDIVRYNETTNEFGVVGKSGQIRTFYKPTPAIHGYKTNMEYFNAQGR